MWGTERQGRREGAKGGMCEKQGRKGRANELENSARGIEEQR